MCFKFNLIFKYLSICILLGLNLFFPKQIFYLSSIIIIISLISFDLINYRKYRRMKLNECNENEIFKDEIENLKDEIYILYKHSSSLNNELKDANNMLDIVKYELKFKTDEITALNNASKIITATFDIHEIIEYVYKVFKNFSGCDRYLICFKENNNILCKYEFGEIILNEKGCVMDDNDSIKESFVRNKTIIKTDVFIEKRNQNGDVFVIPMNVSGEMLGVIYVESGLPGVFMNLNVMFYENLSIYAAIALKNAEMYNSIYWQKKEIESLFQEASAVNDALNTYIEELDKTKMELKEKNEELTVFYDEIQTAYFQTVTALANSIEAKDAYTRGHCQRVMEIACEIGRFMGYSKEKIDDLRYSAILHDIGKIGIPAAIINKVGKLSKDEFNEIKKHPLIAYNILKEVEFIKRGIDGILQHHEKYDGTGYPFGLKGNDISEYGRILCIADAFDAMTSDRPYRTAMALEDAIKEIIKYKNIQFDPEIADILINICNDILKGKRKFMF